MPERHSDAEIDAAIEALSDPQRLEEAQRLVQAKAPQLQRILDQALESADWFGVAHQAEVLKAAGRPDPWRRPGHGVAADRAAGRGAPDPGGVGVALDRAGASRALSGTRHATPRYPSAMAGRARVPDRTTPRKRKSP